MDSLHRSPLPPACHQQSQRVTECYTSLVHARGLTCETLKSSRRPALVAAENWIGNSQKPFSSLKTPRKAMRKEVSLAGLQCFPSLSIFTGPRKIRHLGSGPAGTLQPSGSSLPPGLLVLQSHRIDTDPRGQNALSTPYSVITTLRPGAGHSQYKGCARDNF